MDSGIGDRVDGWVTGGALGRGGGRGRWGRGRQFYLHKEKGKEESSRTAGRNERNN